MTFEYMKTIYHLIETRTYEGRTWYILPCSITWDKRIRNNYGTA